ncbi:two-component system, chemotaxis family, response regulator CheB [Geoalkalibacter ferrihydriticus]|uniref:Protein-glutamate methylesterase/protein-glutamine glutaminase n=2 Tax=Geoalkalibacter ferrihydriticus TaxID=392333 RepID=A0A0C2HKI6_9BACT|nr:chemotaxis response regulator protein-glutamate methylesterase [Geoalkalibacter ferrihydriticus]KIH77576.1 chemotaxis protein [Geoalkalibacter ferrihydriticus DSM 17813]SDL68828.1 two-component system, chemotaxis family, response regulator CheB [Geoalkalibacter ferrihydriticus]
MVLNKVRVLVVDDSALVRQILTQGLNADPAIEVVGSAADPYQARDKIIQLQPDVLTLDVEMPRMDGVEFLRRLMPQHPMPVVMVSSLTQKGKQITIDALEAGAVDFVAKPTADVARGLQAMMLELRVKVKIASTANVSHWKAQRLAAAPPPRPPLATTAALAESTDKVIAIGASTGGTEAIKKVITRFPATSPGVVIVQHMPAGFTKMFAERLNQLCPMEVKEASSGDRVMPGRILVAPGEKQMRVIRSGGFYQVTCELGEKVSGHCPSVDVMMHSVAKHVGANAVAAMLTGMGADGADGMAAMRQAGARCIAQDEASCVVFGMPKVAYERGGAEKLLPIDDIAPALLRLLSERRA